MNSHCALVWYDQGARPRPARRRSLGRCSKDNSGRHSAQSGRGCRSVREFSARLFKESKRLEALTPQLDVLLSGIEKRPKSAAQVWQELGLFREEHPVLLTDAMHIERDRSFGLVDAPYMGLPGLAPIPRTV